MQLPPSPFPEHSWGWAFVLFRPIPDFFGYAADTDGCLWTCRLFGRNGGIKDRIGDRWRKRVLSFDPDSAYLSVTLRRDGKSYGRYVHRLVLETFIGKCPEGMECCHNDGNKFNNNIRNLRWDTPSGNKRDNLLHGTRLQGEKVFGSKLNAELVRRIFELRASGLLQREISKEVGVTRSNVSMVLSGKAWSHVSHEFKVAQTRSKDRLVIVRPEQ